MYKKFFQYIIYICFIEYCFCACLTTRVEHDYWWDNYSKGVRHTKSKSWENAEKYFKMAILDRFDDEMLALTYRRNYINYFPHRELGYAYYYMEKYEEAIKELEIALSFEKTAKAYRYLDRSRTKWIKHNSTDRLPPEINILYPKSTKWINDSYVIIKGNVIDDTYVKHVSIDKYELPVYVSNRQIAFYKKIPVNLGKK
ncbi:hypothetical protein MHK_001466, partial [Candidatus Magnetomorum sp. HK-1]